MSERIILIVDSSESGHRLDWFVSQKLEQFSRSTVQRWIESGHVTMGGQSLKANYQVRKGQEIVIIPPPPQPVQLVAEPIPLHIVYEDSALVVVDKPSGLVVHPGAGNRQGTLANALLHHFQTISRTNTIRPGIVHRLDKETSGLMVVAKNDQAHEFLASQFKARQVEKRYLALVYGRLKKKAGIVDVSLGRDPWARTKISTRSRRARKAITRYEVIRYYRDFTYVRGYPRTGRTHQIRVHFQHLGHPVVGDETYGGKAIQHLRNSDQAKSIQDLGRYFLHADFLAFLHPETGKTVSFEIPLPDKLAEFLLALG
ncbi:RluA family pseudouridine synthase [Acidobacteria bacterium AH-259-D05]|nr:RluA family pseudouridine synthase [Acidobacteria bacterium AH-259-D05]